MSAKHEQADARYYSDDDVARLLGVSLGRLRNKLSAGNPLPPRIQLPGCRHRLWSRQDVHDWLDQFTVAMCKPERPERDAVRPGRPTKAEVRARRR